MVRLTFLALLAFILISNRMYSQARYISPTPGEFPIIASTVFNSEKGPQPGDLEGVRDCGFNVCMDITTPERFEQLLGYMEGTGLRLLLQGYPFMYYPQSKNTQWKESLPALVDEFKDNPLLGGWKFCDEPKWDALGEWRQRYDLLEKCDRRHLIYINLVGQMAKEFTGPCKDLSQYLDSIDARLPMDVWSFDFYPIIIRQGKFMVEYKGFYTALEAFSKKAKQTGRPMWSYLESMEYVMGNHARPAATQPYLSFAAFSSLAYGAQGILYWTYWQRPSEPIIEHLPALVDMEGNKTKAWYAAQKVNRQIKALTPVFLGAEMDDVRHTGMINMPGTYPFLNNFGPLETLSNDVKGVLVSTLHNNGHNYLVIVNHDVEKKQKVRMNFRKNLTVTRLVASDAGQLSIQNVKSSYNVTLTPGGYAVFEY